MCGHANSCDRIRCSKSDSIQLPSCLLHELPSSPAAACSTSFTTAGYGSHQNVFIRLDPLGRPPSATGSYATIASLNKYPTETKKSCSIFDRKSANYLTFLPFLLPFDSIQLATNYSMFFLCSPQASAARRRPRRMPQHCCPWATRPGRPFTPSPNRFVPREYRTMPRRS